MMTGGLPFFTFGILTGICEMVQAEHPSAWLRDPVVLLSSGMWMAYATMVVAIWLRPRNRQSQFSAAIFSK